MSAAGVGYCAEGRANRAPATLTGFLLVAESRVDNV
jgi:hypothetical protein